MATARMDSAALATATLKAGERHKMFFVSRKISTSAVVKANATSEYKRTGTYTGTWRDNKRDGLGTAVTSAGGRSGGTERYEGEFMDDQRHGQGRLWTRVAGRAFLAYDGEWERGQRSGRGVGYEASGEVYEGQWYAGQRHGAGTCRYADGSIYAGGWESGMRSGHGQLRLANGDIFEGTWQRDAKHGRGRFIYTAKAQVYDGEWFDGVPRAGELRALSLSEQEKIASSGLAPRIGAEPANAFPSLELASAEEVLARATSAARSGVSSAAGAGEGLGAASAQLRDGEDPYSLDTAGLGLSEDEAAQLAAAFRTADADGSGRIALDPESLAVVVSMLGIDAGPGEVDALIDQIRAEAAAEGSTLYDGTTGGEALPFRYFAACLSRLRE